MLPEPWSHVQRLLVVRMDNLGDLVMLGPALRLLREAMPSVDLTLMASPGGARAIPLLPWIDQLLVHRPLWQDIGAARLPDPAAQHALVEQLRSRRFDAAMIFTSFAQSPYPPALFCYLAGIPTRVGMSKEFGGGVLTHWIPAPADALHQVDRNLLLLRSLGFAAGEGAERLEVQTTDADRAAVDRLLGRVGLGADEPLIALAPGASCAARRYDAPRWGKVARLLCRQAGRPVVLVGSEREMPLATAVLGAARDPGVRSLVGQTSVGELAEIVRRAWLVLANNSAALHLAEAQGRPMVILYSGTDLEDQWRPRHAPARLLRRPTSCHPCYRFQCPYDMECLDIGPQEVATAGIELLERTGTLDHLEGNHSHGEEGDRSMFSDNVVDAIDVEWPKNGPVPARPGNGRP